MDAVIISIGSEVVSGAVVDTNAAWLASRLSELGVFTTRHVTIGDDRDLICAAVGQAAREAGLVLITGGLGPTQDDMTREALAEVIGQPLECDDHAVEHIRSLFHKMGRPMAEANLRQAQKPRGTDLLENPWGTAPGLRIPIGGARVVALPGVPREMRNMFERHVTGAAREHAVGSTVCTRVIRTYGEGESAVAGRIDAWMTPGRNPAVGTQASEGVISIRIMGRGPDEVTARRCVDADAAAIRGRLGEIVYGEGLDTLESVVVRRLIERGETVGVAESCTGGLIAAALTNVPGSSGCFGQGYVVYSNQAKTDLLGVPADLLERHGAVSAPVAEAMARGCRQRAGVDHAVAVTGIAGPTGGSPEKPVGLVYIGLAGPDECRVERHQWSDHLDRAAIRDRTTKAALNLLRLVTR
jgi:nicotinamide-nucleotide amidase